MLARDPRFLTTSLMIMEETLITNLYSLGGNTTTVVIGGLLTQINYFLDLLLRCNWFQPKSYRWKYILSRSQIDVLISDLWIVRAGAELLE